MSDVAKPVANVYACIAAVSAEMAQIGIGKDRTNQQQGYKFRGIDDVYNALAPIIAKHKLVILPRILSRECVERQAKTGGALFYVTVEAEFDFVSAADGSLHTTRTFGEAMDSADKATNKAMSAAYKYAAFQTFCIPTEGDNDADAHTHEPEPQTARPAPKPPRAAQPATSQPAPQGSGDAVTVANVKAAKKGTSGRGPWTLWIIATSDGREGKTFEDGIASSAKQAAQEGRSVFMDLNAKGDITAFDFAPF